MDFPNLLLYRSSSDSNNDFLGLPVSIDVGSLGLVNRSKDDVEASIPLLEGHNTASPYSKGRVKNIKFNASKEEIYGDIVLNEKGTEEAQQALEGESGCLSIALQLVNADLTNIDGKVTTHDIRVAIQEILYNRERYKKITLKDSLLYETSFVALPASTDAGSKVNKTAKPLFMVESCEGGGASLEVLRCNVERFKTFIKPSGDNMSKEAKTKSDNTLTESQLKLLKSAEDREARRASAKEKLSILPKECVDILKDATRAFEDGESTKEKFEESIKKSISSNRSNNMENHEVNVDSSSTLENASSSATGGGLLQKLEKRDSSLTRSSFKNGTEIPLNMATGTIGQKITRALAPAIALPVVPMASQVNVPYLLDDMGIQTIVKMGIGSSIRVNDITPNSGVTSLDGSVTKSSGTAESSTNTVARIYAQMTVSNVLGDVVQAGDLFDLQRNLDNSIHESEVSLFFGGNGSTDSIYKGALGKKYGSSTVASVKVETVLEMILDIRAKGGSPVVVVPPNQLQKLANLKLSTGATDLGSSLFRYQELLGGNTHVVGNIIGAPTYVADVLSGADTASKDTIVVLDRTSCYRVVVSANIDMDKDLPSNSNQTIINVYSAPVLVKKDCAAYYVVNQ